MSDPGEILAKLPASPKRETFEKVLQDKWPGHISWANDRANFPGCRLITFGMQGDVVVQYGMEPEDGAEFEAQCLDTKPQNPEDAVNLYFAHRANLLVIDMKVHADGITLMVTTQLDDEDLEAFEYAQHLMDAGMAEYRTMKAKEKAATEVKIAENVKLIELGRKAKDHNLFEKLRTLEERNASLTRQLKDLEAGDA